MQNPGVAAVLSFLVPGLGQVFRGRIIEGLATFVGVGLMTGVFTGLALPAMRSDPQSAAAMLVLVWIPILAIWGVQVYRAYHCTTYPVKQTTNTNNAVERTQSGWICSECGYHLLYSDSACPKCHSEGRKWSG